MTPALTLLLALPAHAGPFEIDTDSAAGDDDSIPSAEASHTLPIINGEDAALEDYPMTGATIFDGVIDYGSMGTLDATMMLCSSTLVAPDVVLLAAHCLDETVLTYGVGSIEEMDMYWTRQADLSKYDGSRRRDLPDDAVHTTNWVVNGDFDIYGMGTGLGESQDIALLFLDEAQEDLPLAYLPTEEEGAQLEEGMDVEVVGWGQQEATSQWEAPPEGTYLYKQMGLSMIAKLGDAEFKVGEEESDVRKCHGDSGGPSFAEVGTDSSETMRVVGVTSHSYDESDCDKTGGVDTRVDFHLDWIDAQLRAACADGTRVWCEEGMEGILSAPDSGSEAVAEVDDITGEKRRAGACSTAGGLVGPWWLLGLVALGRRRRR